MTLHIVLTDESSAAEAPRGYAHRSKGLYSRFGKRALDILIVFLSLPIVVPIILFLAVLVALDGGKPFYTQDRVGRGGKSYRIWKLRSMMPDADRKLDQYLAKNPAARAEWEHTQKLKKDPRITRIGALLRKASLDELPQLWNVLSGDMSIVGPRPMMPCQRSLYPGTDYYAMRPGITGPWQVSKRNTSSFAERASYDSLYFSRLSLLTDLRLMTATFRVVLRGTGY